MQPLQPLYDTLHQAGFDLHALCFPASIPAWTTPKPILPTALLLGNTRALWPVFLRAYQHSEALQNTPNPLDTFTENTVLHALALNGLSDALHSVQWAHTYTPAPIPIQRIADASGLAWSAPCGLCIHPVYGPWIGLRAVVLFRDTAQVDFGDVVHSKRATACEDCDSKCVPHFERAMRSSGDTQGAWAQWLAVRDACPRGVEHRYSEEQIVYHYTQDRGVLGDV